DQDARVGEEGAGEGDQLPLSEREPRTALADLALVARFETLHEVMCADGAGSGDDVLERCVRTREGDVLADRAGEEEALLRDDAQLAPQRGLGDVAEVRAVDR